MFRTILSALALYATFQQALGKSLVPEKEVEPGEVGVRPNLYRNIRCTGTGSIDPRIYSPARIKGTTQIAGALVFNKKTINSGARPPKGYPNFNGLQGVSGMLPTLCTTGNPKPTVYEYPIFEHTDFSAGDLAGLDRVFFVVRSEDPPDVQFCGIFKHTDDGKFSKCSEE